MNNVLLQNYVVNLAFKNSASKSDICPVVFGDGIVYMSNEKNEYLRTIKDESDNHPYHLYFQEIDSTKTKGGKEPFAEEIATIFNDGPLSPYANDNKIVFSKNIRSSSLKGKNQSKTIGLFFSEKINGIWTTPIPFDYNSADYNITHPAISKDGKFLVYSSAQNMEDSGMDLYYSIYSGTNWSQPKRFGDKINTFGNDVYPTIVGSRIYYSTNGHNDTTGLDIWSFNFEGADQYGSPMKLDSAINSNFDDFGITFKDDLVSGYVTSNRDGSDNIYHFKKLYPSLENCTPQKKISYCYLIEEHNMLDESGMPLKFTWDLGDGTSQDGYRVKHCYDTLGYYTAKLNIVDTVTGDIFYEVSEVTINIQADPLPRIIFKDTLNKNALTEFVADLSHATFTPDEYLWQINNNDQIFQGNKLKETTTQRDSIEVKLGLLKDNEVQCITKTFYFKKDKNIKGSLPNKPKEIILDNSIKDSTETYSVKIHSSETPLSDTSELFNDVNYPITEKYFEFKKLYEYSVGSSTELDELYLLYLEMKDLGFDSELIKAEIDQTIASQNSQTSTTVYFAVSSSEVTTFNISSLQHLIKLHGTDIQLNVLGYADPTGNAIKNKQLSLNRAKSVKKELIKLGVPAENISTKAVGQIESASTEDHVLKLLRKVDVEIKK